MPRNAAALQTMSQFDRYGEAESDAVRRRALERLYERMDAVNDLIYSLENYHRANQPAKCLEFSAARKS
jgi:RecJ-like exonuclease